jgi:hypothetical protein
MIIEIGFGVVAGVASVVALYKHFGAAAVTAEIATIKADVTTAVSKAEATVATIKADLAKYIKL